MYTNFTVLARAYEQADMHLYHTHVIYIYIYTCMQYPYSNIRMHTYMMKIPEWILALVIDEHMLLAASIVICKTS